MPKPFISPLPVIVGVTGHRDIPAADMPELETQIETQLQWLQHQYPHCPIVALSALADGADRLFARAALKTGCRLRVPLPMPRADYEKDFDKASSQEFGELIARADDVFVAEPAELLPGKKPPRGFFYRQAGLYVAMHAHVLIALWDGAQTLFPAGGGTYETVAFMRRENGIVWHVPTARQSGPVVTPSSEAESAMRDDGRLAAIEAFNADVAKQQIKLQHAAEQSKPYVIDAQTEKTLSARQSKLLNAFLCADALSVKNRNSRLTTLRLLSALGLALVLSFLLYDEMESDLMLFVYGAIILVAGALYLFSVRRGFHEKYTAYRALAEALRVQFYWSLGGIAENVCDCYTFTQQSELDFVRFVLRAIDGADNAPAGAEAVSRDGVFRLWLGGQNDYHTASALKKGRQESRNTTAAKCMFGLSVLLFVVALVLELFFKSIAQQPLPVNEAWGQFLRIHEGQTLLWRSVLKIVLGVVSAATAFLANYYGSLALAPQIFYDQRMRALFASAMQQDLADEAACTEVLRMLGRESQIESAAWYVTQRDNTQKLFIG